MIVYSALRSEFTQDIQDNLIDVRIAESLRRKAGIRSGAAEVLSWRNSLVHVNNALLAADIAPDAGVALEYNVPQSSKRIDVIVTGLDDLDRKNAVIIELKQWSTARKSVKDGIVETFLGHAVRETVHPSYQAWTYAALIEDFNEAAHDGRIRLFPCAYLHNMDSGEALLDPHYALHFGKAPVFIRSEAKALQQFLQRHIRKGDQGKVLFEIESGRIRPSKNLADHLGSLLAGRREFDLIDEQKLVYEAALDAVAKAESGGKQVLIVEGGPGTGKSVVAVNLLVELTRKGAVTQYVTRNAAPRDVYQARLAGTMSRTRIANLFRSSGAFVDAQPDIFDALIVDEAHRLNEKSGLYGNLGKNQISEIINAARASVFFVDDDQRITLQDIGEKALIHALAREAGARVIEMGLPSQFRCNGSDGYLAWVNHVLGVAASAHPTLAGIDYDVRVFESPGLMHDEIRRLNAANNKCRVVAGYCWDWKGKNDPSIQDVVIPRYGYARRWNLSKDGSLWIMAPGSVEEVGCIHTCQGLELEYVGVIVGPDFRVRDGRIITDAAQRSRQDRSIRGYRTLLRTRPEVARAAADRIIKNTYRTLMTRGTRGCFIFSTDPETNHYFQSVSTRQPAGPVLMAAEDQSGYLARRPD